MHVLDRPRHPQKKVIPFESSTVQVLKTILKKNKIKFTKFFPGVSVPSECHRNFRHLCLIAALVFAQSSKLCLPPGALCSVSASQNLDQLFDTCNSITMVYYKPYASMNVYRCLNKHKFMCLKL